MVLVCKLPLCIKTFYDLNIIMEGFPNEIDILGFEGFFCFLGFGGFFGFFVVVFFNRALFIELIFYANQQKHF